MDRRTFVKSATTAAAALLVPTRFLLGSTKAPTFDLKDFCEEPGETFRYKLDTPFEQRGLTYATDGKICVRTSLLHADRSDPEERRPDAAGMNHWQIGGARWNRWPDRKLVAPSDGHHWKCPVCYGRERVGTDVRMCQTCQGDPYCCGVKCPTCTGHGYLGGDKCTYCRGGEVDASVPSLQLVGDETIDPMYYDKICKLDCVEWQAGPLTPDRYGPSYRVIRFRFNGGEGCVMPIVPLPSY